MPSNIRAVEALLACVAVIGCGTSENDTSREPRTNEATDAGNDDAACVPLQEGSPHLAIVPVPYTRRRNPLAETADTLAEASALYLRECSRCHGASGRGDGAPTLDPKPADFTVRVHLDDYLFWRISEGGLGNPTCSAMPSFKPTFSEDERWKIVRFVQQFSKPDAGQ